jgi:ABC-type Fe3+-hydroxamate transport system substrate-binding protein
VKAGYREDTYLIPQSDEESLKKVIDHLSTFGKVNLKGVTEKQAEIIETLYKDRFEIIHKRGEDNYVYLTELVIALNLMIWATYGKNDALADVYNELWIEADEYACNNLKGDELSFFYRTTD